MCEPKAGTGLLLLDLTVGTKAGRRTIGTAVTAGALYASTQMMVTVPLAVLIAPAAIAIALAVVALLYRQRAMASAAVANATRQELAAKQARIGVRRVRELEAAVPVLEGAPVIPAREGA